MQPIAFMVLTALLVGVVATNRHMICKDVENIFENTPNQQRAPTRLQGPPGKKGVTGNRGPKGDQGRKGEVDYSIVNASLKELGKVIFEFLNFFGEKITLFLIF